MTGDPQRVINHLRGQISKLQSQLTVANNLIGPANKRYIDAKDRLEAHLAEPHYAPEHRPCVAPSSNPGIWGVYCEACSADSEDFVYPCEEAKMDDEWPPATLWVRGEA